jgi:hypothetical protein
MKEKCVIKVWQVLSYRNSKVSRCHMMWTLMFNVNLASINIFLCFPLMQLLYTPYKKIFWWLLRELILCTNYYAQYTQNKEVESFMVKLFTGERKIQKESYNVKCKSLIPGMHQNPALHQLLVVWEFLP